MRAVSLLGILAFLVGPAGCAEETSDDYLDDPYWELEEGSADIYSMGMPDPGANVWVPAHAWTDTTPDGKTYDELYAEWLAGILHDSGGQDVRYTLADGTVVPAPSLECADTALFLRFLFASEYGLPMFVRGWNNGGWNYWGHFGWLDSRGARIVNYANHPINAERGSYAPLQNRNRYLPENLQSYPFEGATIGQYLDAVLTNKRFGFFVQDLWTMIYSGSIVDDYNTFYVRPEVIHGGDLQMHRYDSTGGIGHTITIQDVERSPSGERLVRVDIIQSYMPTHPWIVNGYSELTSYTPDPATHGGLRRWRRPTLQDGRWYMVTDESVAAVGSEVPNNPQRFAELFNLNPQDEVNTMLETIDLQRRALFVNPNSCRRREQRETAFGTLYELYLGTPELYQSLGFTSQPTAEELRVAVDRQYRMVDDYIWAPLTYESSWVCHWNPSDTAVNNDMYRATVAYNREALAASGCEALRVFRAEDVSSADGTDGFDDLATWARDHGYQWAAYRNDENGNLTGVVDDVLADPQVIAYFCSIFSDLEYWTQP